MSTLKQKKLARAIVENTTAKIPKNKKELLVSVGYSEITAGAIPSNIMEQKGVQEELEVLGFDEYTAKGVVSEILRDQTLAPKDRLNAADKVFKVRGSYAPEKHVNLNVEVETTEKVRLAADELNEIYRGRNISSDGAEASSVDD